MSPYLYPAATTFRLLDLKIALVAARGIEIIEEDLLLLDLQHYIQAAYLKYAPGSYCTASTVASPWNTLVYRGPKTWLLACPLHLLLTNASRQ